MTLLSSIWAIARQDLRVWFRSPALLAASVLPALAMGSLIGVMTLSIGRQPVAVVQEGHGPLADHLAHLLEVDDEAYILSHTTRDEAKRALDELRVAAVVVIPEDFDRSIAHADGHVELWLDNVLDVDLADDIRRALLRSLAEFDAPQLGILGELHGPSEGLILPNPFRVAIAERDRRETNVGFFEYELAPILVLLLLNVGVLGTALLVAREEQRSTLKVLLLSPVARTSIVVGKLLGGMLASTCVAAPILALAFASHWLVMPASHWPAFVALVLSLIMAAVGLGLALGTALRTTRLVALAGLNACAFLFFLGGGFSTVVGSPGTELEFAL